MSEKQPVALITGATEGIGRAIAFALGADGYAVGVCARTADRVAETVADSRPRAIKLQALRPT